jgi:hypothetical protein
MSHRRTRTTGRATRASAVQSFGVCVTRATRCVIVAAAVAATVVFPCVCPCLCERCDAPARPPRHNKPPGDVQYATGAWPAAGGKPRPVSRRAPAKLSRYPARDCVLLSCNHTVHASQLLQARLHVSCRPSLRAPFCLSSNARLPKSKGPTLPMATSDHGPLKAISHLLQILVSTSVHPPICTAHSRIQPWTCPDPCPSMVLPASPALIAIMMLLFARCGLGYRWACVLSTSRRNTCIRASKRASKQSQVGA